jgi:hypothetical protein
MLVDTPVHTYSGIYVSLHSCYNLLAYAGPYNKTFQQFCVFLWFHKCFISTDSLCLKTNKGILSVISADLAELDLYKRNRPYWDFSMIQKQNFISLSGKAESPKMKKSPTVKADVLDTKKPSLINFFLHNKHKLHTLKHSWHCIRFKKSLAKQGDFSYLYNLQYNAHKFLIFPELKICLKGPILKALKSFRTMWHFQ